MYGNTVELVRWLIHYTETEPSYDESGESYMREMTEFATDQTAANDISTQLTEWGIAFTSEELDTSEELWIDGKSFDSYEEAKTALDAGAAAYKPKLDMWQEIETALVEGVNGIDQ
jgi:hypothetical protein